MAKPPTVITLDVPFRLTPAGCAATGGHKAHCSFCKQCEYCSADVAVRDA